jgi:hypothetical protein
MRRRRSGGEPSSRPACGTAPGVHDQCADRRRGRKPTTYGSAIESAELDLPVGGGFGGRRAPGVVRPTGPSLSFSRSASDREGLRGRYCALGGVPPGGGRSLIRIRSTSSPGTRPITSSSASLSATWSAGTCAGNCAWTSTSTPAGRRRTLSSRSRMSTWIRAGPGSTASISRCRRARSSRPRDTPTVAAGCTGCASLSVLMMLAVARASSGGTATRLRSPFTLPSLTHNRPQRHSK